MNSRPLATVVIAVIGIHFVVLTCLQAAMALVVVSGGEFWTMTSSGSPPLLTGWWRTAAKTVAAIAPVILSLEVISNRHRIAARLAGPDDGNGPTISLVALKRTGFGCVGLFLLCGSFADLGSSFSHDYFWHVNPTDIPSELLKPTLQLAIGILLLICGPLLAGPMVGTTESDYGDD